MMMHTHHPALFICIVKQSAYALSGDLTRAPVCCWLLAKVFHSAETRAQIHSWTKNSTLFGWNDFLFAFYKSENLLTDNERSETESGIGCICMHFPLWIPPNRYEFHFVAFLSRVSDSPESKYIFFYLDSFCYPNKRDKTELHFFLRRRSSCVHSSKYFEFPLSSTLS